MTIPFYIVAFNRLSGLEFAMEFSKRSSIPIEPIILDMGSTWGPFVEYRDSLGIKVVSFPNGMGPRELWTKGEIERLGSGPFFLSDGDIDYRDIPGNAFQKLVALSEKYPWFPKVGLSLMISDLPDDLEAERVIRWEKDNWKVVFAKDTFLCGTDTTIAYYPRRDDHFYYRPSLRLGGELTVRHYPWYEREEIPNEESRLYRSLGKASISTTQAMLYPSKRYLVKHFLLVKLYWLSRPLLKKGWSGEMMVSLLSYSGKINPVTQKPTRI